MRVFVCSSPRKSIVLDFGSSLMTKFGQHIGIDYSGRGKISTRTPTIQVYCCRNRSRDAECVQSPSSSDRTKRNWCRQELAVWLADQLEKDQRLLIGIDHGFSMPISYFERYDLKSWDTFLEDFCEHWPTHREGIDVDSIRKPNGKLKKRLSRSGATSEFRITEQWTSSAKSVFQFDMQGSVAKSTHTGIPWLHYLRTKFRKRLHFWPFDGWKPDPQKSVIAEVYPSIFRNRYPREDRTVDQQDAYCVAKWLAAADEERILHRYFDPPITASERTIADREGWILGVC